MNLNKKERLCFPDALRGIAAIWVFGQHLWLDQHTKHLFQLLPNSFNKLLFQFGYLGVAIFFVLSGFFIASSFRQIDMTPNRFRQLCLRRFWRLSPAYYVSIGLTLIMSWLVSQQTQTTFLLPSWIDLLKHFTYLHGIFPAQLISGVFWTLCIEVQFYLFAGMLLLIAHWCKRKWDWAQAPTIIFGLSALIASLWPMQIFTPDWPTPGLFFSYWHSCVLGMFTYWSLQGICRPRWFYAYVGLLSLTTVVGRSLFTGVSIITAVSLYITGRQQKMSERLNWPWLQFVGLVSYAFYLTHEPLLKLLFPLGHHWLGFSVLADVLCLVASLAISLGVAAVLHITIEKPSTRWSKRRGQFEQHKTPA